MNPIVPSAKPLIDKLGYQPEHKIWLLNEPESFKAYLSNEGIPYVKQPPATWFHGFFVWENDLLDFVAHAKMDTIDMGLWFSWPKQAAKVPTDLTEQNFRNELLPMGWVDTKVVSIDQTWSGLKFLRRKQS